MTATHYVLALYKEIQKYFTNEFAGQHDLKIVIQVYFFSGRFNNQANAVQQTELV